MLIVIQYEYWVLFRPDYEGSVVTSWCLMLLYKCKYIMMFIVTSWCLLLLYKCTHIMVLIVTSTCWLLHHDVNSIVTYIMMLIVSPICLSLQGPRNTISVKRILLTNRAREGMAGPNLRVWVMFGSTRGEIFELWRVESN